MRHISFLRNAYILFRALPSVYKDHSVVLTRAIWSLALCCSSFVHCETWSEISVTVPPIPLQRAHGARTNCESAFLQYFEWHPPFGHMMLLSVRTVADERITSPTTVFWIYNLQGFRPALRWRWGFGAQINRGVFGGYHSLIAHDGGWYHMAVEVRKIWIISAAIPCEASQGHIMEISPTGAVHRRSSRWFFISAASQKRRMRLFFLYAALGSLHCAFICAYWELGTWLDLTYNRRIRDGIDVEAIYLVIMKKTDS